MDGRHARMDRFMKRCGWKLHHRSTRERTDEYCDYCNRVIASTDRRYSKGWHLCCLNCAHNRIPEPEPVHCDEDREKDLPNEWLDTRWCEDRRDKACLDIWDYQSFKILCCEP